jgi:hypothetical protein
VARLGVASVARLRSEPDTHQVPEVASRNNSIMVFSC